jgi:hypothetical protein
VIGIEFYCQPCDRWNAHEPYTDDELETIAEGGEVNPVCIRCREPFQCGECGYEIDHEGNCLRPPEDGVPPHDG